MRESKTEDLLIKLRKEHDYTQSDLAMLLGVSFQAVSKWERGENLPDSMLLLELAKLYQVTVDELLRGELLEKPDKKMSIKKRNWIIIIGVFLFMVAPIPYLFLYETYEMFSLILIISFVIAGTLLFVYLGLNYDSFSYHKFSNKTHKQKRIEDIIYGICAVIFLVLGLMFNLFHIAWVVFILGWVATLIFEHMETNK